MLNTHGKEPNVPEDSKPTAEWLTKEIKGMFADPRFKYLSAFGDLEDQEPENLHYDRMMALQSAAAVLGLQSAERQSRTLVRATWALVAATIGLVVATVVLVLVTVVA